MNIGSKIIVEVHPRAWVVGVAVDRKHIMIYLLCVAIAWRRSSRPFGPA